MLDRTHVETLHGTRREVVFQQGADVGEGDVRVVEVCDLRDDLRHSAFKLANVRAGDFRYVHLYVFGNVQVVGVLGGSIFLDKALDDSQLRFDLRRLDVIRSAGVESACVALVNVDHLRCAVCRENHLFSHVGELVEKLEDNIDRCRFSLEVLDVVDEEDVGIEIAVLEILVAVLILVMRRNGCGVVREELSRVDVDDMHALVRGEDVVLNGAKQMRFPKAASSVDEEGVEVFLPRLFSYGDGHGVGEPVRISHNEGLERKGRCERGVDAMFSLLTICVLLVFPRTFRAFRLGDIRIFHHEFFERGVFLGHERRHAIDRVGLFGGVVLCGRNALLRRDGLIRVVRGGRFWRWHVGRCGRGGLLGRGLCLRRVRGRGRRCVDRRSCEYGLGRLRRSVLGCRG